jgi:hypothetical protein
MTLRGGFVRCAVGNRDDSTRLTMRRRITLDCSLYKPQPSMPVFLLRTVACIERSFFAFSCGRH